MIKKPAILISLAVLVLSSLACSIGLPVNTQKTGDTQTLTVEEEHSTGSPVNLTLSMGAGKFTLKPGTEKLVEGIITYNVRRT